MKHKHNSGFTLIELMIATALIAILAGFAIPAYNGYVKTAKKSECLNEIEAIKLAQEEYYLEYNSYFAGVRNSSSNTLSSDAVSKGYYSGAYTAEDNCTYTVVAGPTGDIATSFQLTATGANKLSGEGVIETFTKQ